VQSYQLLRQYARVLPHITIGLQGGEIGHEIRALEILGDLGVEGLVLIVFIPTAGTRYADRQPPEIGEVVDILVESRLCFPHKPLYLGCMRPRGALSDRVRPPGRASWRQRHRQPSQGGGAPGRGARPGHQTGPGMLCH
jgi:uncharacterized radical SAM superfamily protein